jgi:hypothetical protein
LASLEAELSVLDCHQQVGYISALGAALALLSANKEGKKGLSSSQ